nr:MAG TPA: hypothetical protein [Caudoviricetes sp.]
MASTFSVGGSFLLYPPKELHLLLIPAFYFTGNLVLNNHSEMFLELILNNQLNHCWPPFLSNILNKKDTYS